MANNMAIEEGIGKFLDEQDITIVPETRGDRDVIGYIQHQTGGKVLDLGETIYDPKTGRADAVPMEVVQKRHQVKGFVTYVTRPVTKLLIQTEGQFYENSRWNPVHDACERVESRYN